MNIIINSRLTLQGLKLCVAFFCATYTCSCSDSSVSDEFEASLKEIALKKELKISQQSFTFPFNGGNVSANIESTNTSWSIEQLPDWISVSQVQGISSGSITFTASSNNSGQERKGTAFLVGNGLSLPIEFLQEVPMSNIDFDDFDAEEEWNQYKLTFTVKGVSFDMILVEHGTFTMGATAEQGSDNLYNPVHQVTLTNDYYIGETEVTQALWKAVTGYSPISGRSLWYDEELGDNYPAYFISYTDILSFITQLNSLTGKTFRMPTEAEWEFAARGGNMSGGFKYSGSNNIDDVAWYPNNSNSITHQVKTKQPNELGIYDMSGNVWEWCYDWWGYYDSSSQTNPIGPSSGSGRVCRGGSFFVDYCPLSHRNHRDPESGFHDSGFRLALSQ